MCCAWLHIVELLLVYWFAILINDLDIDSGGNYIKLRFR